MAATKIPLCCSVNIKLPMEKMEKKTTWEEPNYCTYLMYFYCHLNITWREKITVSLHSPLELKGQTREL